MSNELTSKQRDILDYIENHVSQKGYPPSVREICEAVGLKSTSTVHGHLQRLEKKGFIRRDQTKPRAIGVLEGSEPDNVIPFPQREVADIPIVGKVTAGEPILAVENYEDTFPVPMEFIDNGRYFMLRVKGIPWWRPASSTGTTFWCASSPMPGTATMWWPCWRIPPR